MLLKGAGEISGEQLKGPLCPLVFFVFLVCFFVVVVFCCCFFFWGGGRGAGVLKYFHACILLFCAFLKITTVITFIEIC